MFLSKENLFGFVRVRILNEDKQKNDQLNIFHFKVVEYDYINLRPGPVNTGSATKASVVISFQLFIDDW